MAVSINVAPAKQDRFDVVYLLGNGAEQTDDWELRISLRSWLSNFPELGTFWIIGHRPGWLDLDHPKIRWIDAEDPYRTNKDANLVQKMIRAAATPEISERFLFCSDDQGLLKPCVFGDFKPYHCGKIRDLKLSDDRAGHRKWQERLLALADFLDREGLRSMHFDGHIPYPLEKSKVLDYLNTDFGAGGYPLMSLYFNIQGVSGIPIGSDRVRAALYAADERPSVIDKKLSTNLFYSIGGGSPDCWYLVHRLEEMFPEQAAWEIGESRPRSETIRKKGEKERDRLRNLMSDLDLLETAIDGRSANPDSSLGLVLQKAGMGGDVSIYRGGIQS